MSQTWLRQITLQRNKLKLCAWQSPLPENHQIDFCSDGALLKTRFGWQTHQGLRHTLSGDIWNRVPRLFSSSPASAGNLRHHSTSSRHSAGIGYNGLRYICPTRTFGPPSLRGYHHRLTSSIGPTSSGVKKLLRVWTAKDWELIPLFTDGPACDVLPKCARLYTLYSSRWRQPGCLPYCD